MQDTGSAWTQAATKASAPASTAVPREPTIKELRQMAVAMGMIPRKTWGKTVVELREYLVSHGQADQVCSVSASSTDTPPAQSKTSVYNNPFAHTSQQVSPHAVLIPPQAPLMPVSSDTDLQLAFTANLVTNGTADLAETERTTCPNPDSQVKSLVRSYPSYKQTTSENAESYNEQTAATLAEAAQRQFIHQIADVVNEHAARMEHLEHTESRVRNRP